MSKLVVIPSKIVSVRLGVKSESKPQTVVTATPASDTIPRPEGGLTGTTYKLRTPLSECAIYITINNVILNQGTPQEVVRPFEIFINSKHADHFQWIVALTRLISAIFRKGGDSTFIIAELRSVFDPGGGYLTKAGRVPSLVAEIGIVIEKHFRSLGLLTEDLSLKNAIAAKVEAAGQLSGATVCPKCGAHSFVQLEGCPTCLSCSYSKCG